MREESETTPTFLTWKCPLMMKPLVKIKNIGTSSCLSFRYDSEEYKIQATRDQQSAESTKSAVKGDYRF